MQAFSLQSISSSPRLLHQSSAPSSGLATPQLLEPNHSTGLQLQRSGGDSDQVCNYAALATLDWLCVGYNSNHGKLALPKQWMSRHMHLNLHAETSAKLEACSL